MSAPFFRLSPLAAHKHSGHERLHEELAQSEAGESDVTRRHILARSLGLAGTATLDLIGLPELVLSCKTILQHSISVENWPYAIRRRQDGELV